MVGSGASAETKVRSVTACRATSLSYTNNPTASADLILFVDHWPTRQALKQSNRALKRSKDCEPVTAFT